MRGVRRLVAAVALLMLAPLLVSCKDNGNQLIKDKKTRTDPNPHQPEPTHPVYFRGDGHYEDVPSGANMEFWAGSGRHQFSGSPEIFDSLALRYPEGSVFTPSEIPHGIQLTLILKATAPSIPLKPNYKPRLFCKIVMVDAVNHHERVLRPEHDSTDRHNGITCRTRIP